MNTFTGRPTGIGKEPVDGRVEMRDPGPKNGGLGSGLVGDAIAERKHHGGSEQAVYAYARESLDWWSVQLNRVLPPGQFGENLTTTGLDVDGAIIGERWHIGRDVILQVTGPRIPCATFRGRMAERGWVRRFAAAQRPGAYLSVVAGGQVAAGDEVQVIDRPSHQVTVATVFRALLGDRALLPSLLEAGHDLPVEIRDFAVRGETYELDG